MKTKLKQADYALNALKIHTREPRLAETATDQAFSAEEKVYFYSDSFWAFLCAALDVLAQIINQTNSLGFDERTPSFKTVLERLSRSAPNSPLTRILTRIRDSNYYKSLDKYRNCGLHRRHIFVERREQTATVPPGYTPTLPVRTTEWILCDDPYTLNPRTRQNREIVDFCQKCKNRIITTA